MKSQSVAPIRQSATVGVGFMDPSDYHSEMLGVGFVWADLSGAGLRDESIVEAFFRFQLTRMVQLSPDLQLVINPAGSDEDVVAVFGIRLQATF